ncbi:hypothetical protein [Caulobacter sp. UC70_42]|uniref:hypothetical protein n=1 Tax=Caulobacter sp. UC70_42 TaxID=3374551 RepID=UPI0037579E2A
MKLKIVDVKSKGDYDNEYVVLRATADCNLKDYMVCDETYDAAGKSNLNRHSYWFPDHLVTKGDYVTVWTKTGKNIVGQMESGDPAHRFFWNLKEAVWNDSGDVAHLVEIADVASKTVPAVKPKP